MNTQRTIWEYELVIIRENLSPQVIERMLNEKGAEGWELVGFEGGYKQLSDSTGRIASLEPFALRYYFKRPK